VCIEKSPSDEGGWRRVKIVLKPLNPDFVPIVITDENEWKGEVIAKFPEVLG